MTEDRALPTNEKERQELKAMLVEITHCLSRVDNEREQIKEILKAGEEKTGIKKKQLRKLANTMYRQDYASVQAEHEHFETLYESLVEGRKVASNDNDDDDNDDDGDDQDD